jgi:hypothetical protein
MEPKGLSRVHKSQPQGPIMSQMNPARAVISGNLKYILILGTYSTYVRAKILYRQHLSPTHPPHPPRCIYHNNTRWKVQMSKLRIT